VDGSRGRGRVARSRWCCRDSPSEARPQAPRPPRRRPLAVAPFPPRGFHVAELPTVTYCFRAAACGRAGAALETIALVRLDGESLWALGS